MSVGSSVDIYYICNFVVYIERENDYTFNRIISLEQTSQNAISTDLFLGWRGGGVYETRFSDENHLKIHN